MNINQDMMNKINDIQFEIFKEFIDVCSRLNLKYYVVHGTLLGALRYGDFFPFDDDIDVAMPRKDYDIFLKEAQTMLSSKLFVQSTSTENDYPLCFSKLRNSETAFIQPVLDDFKINKGIYIDVFPIDFYPEDPSYLKKIKMRERLLSIRVNGRVKASRSIKQKIAIIFAKYFIPNWQKAVKSLSNLYSNVEQSKLCIVYGGKTSEIGIPFNWFDEGTIMSFRDIEVRAPKHFDLYLEKIYGDYRTYSPSERHMVSDSLVKVSASIIDLEKSYKEYQDK